MAIYQGDEKIVDRYVGETLVTRAYQSDKLIFDAYSELSGTLPLSVRSRASQILKNYIIYGESVQDGTPAPDNPVEVTGLGVRMDNLFDYKNASLGYYLNPTTGNIVSSANSDTSSFIDVSDMAYVTISLVLNGTLHSTLNREYVLYNENKQRIRSGAYRVNTISKVIVKVDTENASFIRFDYDKSHTNVMLTEGSTAPETYIPYGYKLPIKVTSNGTTTDYPIYIGDSQLMRIPNTEYADYVDYEKGKIVRYIKEYTFTGDESFSAYGAGFIWTTGFSGTNSTGLKITTFFSHFTARANPAISLLYDYMVYRFGDDCACFRDGYSTLMLRSTANFTTVKECKAYFKSQYDNGTPVKMWYALATPIEEDPPVPFPDITLPQGTVTIDIDGNLKPQSTVKGRINPTA